MFGFEVFDPKLRMGLMRKHVWTPEQDETVLLAAKANHSAMRVAVRLKRSIESVRRRAGELGVEFKGVRQVKAETRAVLSNQDGAARV
jgi:hypothetical protein